MKKRLRNILLLIVTLCLLISSFPITASAASDFVVEGGILKSYSGSSQTVTIPSDVYYVADSAFENNTNITSVNLNNVSVIGNKAFANCTKLKTITGSDNVTACGAYAFFGTPYLKTFAGKALVLGNVLVNSSEEGEVIIDSSVVSVAPYAFSSNTKITTVKVADGVASIGEGAFYNCAALKNVTVSKHVSYIGAYAFEGTPYLSAVKDDFLVIGKGILVDVNSTSSDITIPDTVEQIGAGAFLNNKNLKTVKIPESVKSIGMRAFAKCSSLKTAVLPESLIHLDKEAFLDCTSLESVVIPKGVSLIGESVFLGCTGIKTAQMLSSADISKGMFASCTGLESVMLSDGIDAIENYAFYNCKELKEISVPTSVEYVSDTAFSGAEMMSVWCTEGSAIETYCNNKSINAYAIGDANMDGNVNIRDATEIQKASAKILSMSFSASLRGDADFSGDINILDATTIQKYVAGIKQ